MTELEKLKQALEDIVRYEEDTEWVTYNEEAPLDVVHCANIARRALGFPEKPE